MQYQEFIADTDADEIGRSPPTVPSSALAVHQTDAAQGAVNAVSLTVGTGPDAGNEKDVLMCDANDDSPATNASVSSSSSDSMTASTSSTAPASDHDAVAPVSADSPSSALAAAETPRVASLSDACPGLRPYLSDADAYSELVERSAHRIGAKDPAQFRFQSSNSARHAVRVFRPALRLPLALTATIEAELGA